ncbi:UNVERIFIED_CONTAM: hypothetical protein GTU68_026407 [Idotea baltica]|nr:hypothetical protein [Idotea baltica]
MGMEVFFFFLLLIVLHYKKFAF